MSEKCGEYDEAMTYLIWVCCAPRKGKLDFTVVFLFDNLLLPFDASGPLMGHNLIPTLPISPTFFSFYADYNTEGHDEGLRGMPEVVNDGYVLCQ